MALTFRTALTEDASTVAQLHAASWRRHYRGAYSDAYLDGDVLTDREQVWSARLAAPAGTLTVLAEDEAGPAGFLHLVLDEDERWGSLVDNLHVRHGRQRTGVGGALVRRAAAAVAERARRQAMYLWVLEQNHDAQRFYAAMGGTNVEKALVEASGKAPGQLVGTPGKLRIAWAEAGIAGLL
ncbi:GNAT family N-acetyltransferase [Catenulispora pinisilvae]|uniref:GNAT family N-acetyltransferase n=1 Tax=Catenulispora pinisilvae TaxID=2705253 RepID=UPI0018927A4F|nr:GNAT family N-acetyltransferase [Catenulispora pinisilvae]